MNVFVTGATGKVGSRFVRRLLQQGHHVKCLVRDIANAHWLQQLGAEVLEGDLLQTGSWGNTLQGTDAVVHLAAQFRGVDENTARRSNIDASIELAHAALRADVPRFIFTSTSLVYGAGNHSRPNHEDDLLRPTMPYPQTKVAAEEALLQLYRRQGLGLRIVRLGFVYGDSDPHITEFLPMMKNWNPAQRFHMVHHADVSQALHLAATVQGVDGRIYNVADDAPISVSELFQFHNSEVPQESNQQEFNPWQMVVDTTRIREELNYRPIFPSYLSAKYAGAL